MRVHDQLGLVGPSYNLARATTGTFDRVCCDEQNR